MQSPDFMSLEINKTTIIQPETQKENPRLPLGLKKKKKRKKSKETHQGLYFMNSVKENAMIMTQSDG